MGSAHPNVAEHRCGERRAFRGQHPCRAFQRRRAGGGPSRSRPPCIRGDAKQEVFAAAGRQDRLNRLYIRLVEAAIDARNTHFSHMSCRTVSLHGAVEIAASDDVRDGANPGLTFCRRARRNQARAPGPAGLLRASCSVSPQSGRARPAPGSTHQFFCRERPEMTGTVEQRDDHGPLAYRRRERLGWHRRGRRPCNSTARRQTCP